MLNPVFLNKVVQLSHKAGDVILNIYNRHEGFAINTKNDQSPVTEADLAANELIVEGLNQLTPDIPILTEESVIPAFSERKQWLRYWLVDPLDGTKEFISRNGEFTVNIALIEDGVPILGVVHMPTLGDTYTGLQGLGGYKLFSGTKQKLAVKTLVKAGPLTLVASRRHGTEKMKTLLKQLEGQFTSIDYTFMGSSLKLCLVATGEADIYPRLAPTSEWDTAAAQAVVEAAGGYVIDEQFQPLRYNQKDSMLNPFFYVLGDKLDVWRGIITKRN